MSVYDCPLPSPPSGDLYDAVYFSGSITLMPDPAGALRAVRCVWCTCTVSKTHAHTQVAKMLRPNTGTIYITQTFQVKSVPFMNTIKPMLKYLTSIDFGALTFEQDMFNIIKAADMVLL